MRLRDHVMTSNPLVSIVIPTWNGRHLLGPCLESLRLQTYPRREVIVVDGGSNDGSVALLEELYPEVNALGLPRNLGFSGNVNAGLRTASGELVALLNNDAEADPRWVAELVTAAEAYPRAGAFASKMVQPGEPRTIASAGDLLGRDGLARQRGAGEPDNGRFDRADEVFSACGGAALYRRSMLDDVGLLDQGYVSYLEDVDLGLRARLRGWGCRYVPTARVLHRGSATGGGRLASYYVARNSIRLIARGLPTALIRVHLPLIVAAQARRAAAAARAWRGEAARATLRGLAAGIVNLPDALRGRRSIQGRRTLADADFAALLTE